MQWVIYEPYAYMEEEAAYKLAVDDSSTVKKYLLEDPDGYGSIGSLTDDQKVNKASREERGYAVLDPPGRPERTLLWEIRRSSAG